MCYLDAFVLRTFEIILKHGCNRAISSFGKHGEVEGFTSTSPMRTHKCMRETGSSVLLGGNEATHSFNMN